MVTINSKYEKLYNYLKLISSNNYIMTFQEVEEVLGFSLPPSAYKYTAWWDSSLVHTQAYAWREVGFKAQPNLADKTVQFVKYS